MRTQTTSIGTALPAPLEDLLAVYVPVARCVKGFEMHDGVAHAQLQVHDPCYCEAPGLAHLTAVELQLCLNQMLYCYFALTGALGTFQDYRRLAPADLAQWQAAKTYLIEQRFKFHRSVGVDTVFPATLRLERSRKTSRIYVATVTFDFANGACVGKAKVAIVP